MRIDDRPNPHYRARSHARWLTVILLAAFIAIFFANTAQAYNCEDNGEPGWYNGSTADDAGCITQAEYVALTSPDALLEVGVITSSVDNGDGTVTVTYANGGVGVLEADPLERPVAATPALEPDAPTVREVLWSFPATATRLTALVG